MKRWIKLAALATLAALLLTGCLGLPGVDVGDSDEPKETQPPLTEPMYEDREALYQYYNQVKIGDTMASIKERYGEPEVEQTENGDTYTWVMEDGYGFAAVFFENGKLRAKVLYYKDMRQLGKLSGATSIDQFANLNKNYTYEMACGLMGGRSMEIAQVAQDSSAEPEVKRVFVWANEKGDCIQVLFSGDEKLEQVTYTLAE
ncbi:MAG: hypothetical protein IKS52_08935 [Clostridia bacterium]|nr:hypothetical protein [Clostridia bacterium]